MIEPERFGPALVEEIRATRPAAGSVAVWWLGQSGFLLKSAGATVLIDPYLSEHLTRKYEGTARPHVRMTRAPLAGRDLAGIDLLLASHKHSDHLDPGTATDVLAVNPETRLGLPASIVPHAVAMGIAEERLVGLVEGARLEMPGIVVRAVPSAHEGLDTDDLGRHLYLGFVVEVGGLRFYHSGDSLDYPGLAGAIGPEPVDVMFLPVNGRDPSRGVPGNMTAAEAVALANRVRPRFVVPHHYDMFTFNTAPISEFKDAARGLVPGTTAKVLRCGGLEVFR